MTLRMIFGPLIKVKVTIMRDISPSYALQRVLAVTRTLSLLDSVVEVNINLGKSRYVPTDPWRAFKMSSLVFPAISTLVKAVPTMRQLHTIHLSRIFLARTHLCYILSSPHLTHLILETIQMPKISTLPPPKLRKLTIVAMFTWKALQPLIAHLATSLEYLELRWCEFRPLEELQLPSFPSLWELHHHQHFIGTFPDESKLTELFRLASQVTCLHLFGSFRNTRVAAFPKSLQHLSIHENVLKEHEFGTGGLPQLVSLNIRLCSQGLWRLNHRPMLPSFIRDRFPGITSLQLDIQWSLRNFALVMARSQRNVRLLELCIATEFGLHWERELSDEVEVPTEYLCETMLPATMQTLKLEVVQISYELERSVECCARWINSIVLPSATGLGGSDLKSIDVSFVQPERGLARERALSRRWAKLPGGDWQIEKF